MYSKKKRFLGRRSRRAVRTLINVFAIATVFGGAYEYAIDKFNDHQLDDFVDRSMNDPINLPKSTSAHDVASCYNYHPKPSSVIAVWAESSGMFPLNNDRQFVDYYSAAVTKGSCHQGNGSRTTVGREMTVDREPLILALQSLREQWGSINLVTETLPRGEAERLLALKRNQSQVQVADLH